MAACKTLQPIFNNPLDLISSCNHIPPMKPLDGSPIDVFSRFGINEKPATVLSLDHNISQNIAFKSFDDVQEFNDQWEQKHEYTATKHVKFGQPKKSQISGKEFPPISSIGRQVCFKSYRYNGRLVLKEEKTPKQEILHAFRENGRLKLQFIHFDDDVAVQKNNTQKVQVCKVQI